jgi:hypothetical protein
VRLCVLRAELSLTSYFQPWATSGMIWMAFMDYLKWTGDGQFSTEVTAALVNMSYGKTQDFLDGAQAALQSSILGKWNDDILWPAQACVFTSSSSSVPHADAPSQLLPELRSTATKLSSPHLGDSGSSSLRRPLTKPGRIGTRFAEAGFSGLGTATPPPRITSL